MIGLIELILIVLLITALGVLLIAWIFIDDAKKKRVRINTVDRLFDSVRFNTDLKSRARFKRTLSLLVKYDFKIKRLFKKAAIRFMKIAKKTPDPLDKAYCLGWAGRCYEDYGNSAIAATCYAAAVGVAPSDTFASERLGDYFWEGDSEESEKHYKQLLEYDPICSRAYYKLGRLYSSKGKSDEAIMQYKKAIEVQNGYIAPIAEAAIEYAKKGDKANSLKFYLLAMANDLYEFEKLEEAITSCLTP